MTKEEIIEITNGFLSEEFEVDIDTLRPEAILKDTLGLDSLDYVDLVVTVQSHCCGRYLPHPICLSAKTVYLVRGMTVAVVKGAKANFTH